MSLRHPWPTTAQEAHHAARSHARRVEWADTEADKLRERWAATAAARNNTHEGDE